MLGGTEKGRGKTHNHKTSPKVKSQLCGGQDSGGGWQAQGGSLLDMLSTIKTLSLLISQKC